MFLCFLGSGNIVESRDLFTMKKLFLQIVVKQKDCFWNASKDGIVC